MLTVKSPNYELTFHSEWNEVTLADFMKLYENIEQSEDEPTVEFPIRKALEAFASDVKTLLLVEAAEEAVIVKHLPFLTQIPQFDQLPVPTLVLGVVPPTELGTCTLMQKWSVEQVISDMNDEGQPVNYFNIAEQILSIYLYPQLQKRPLTDMEELKEISLKIQSIPCTEALPLAAFFLSKYNSSTPSGKTSFVTSYPTRPKKRWLPGWFRNWRLIRNWRS